jgi:hypothetical protein
MIITIIKLKLTLTITFKFKLIITIIITITIHKKISIKCHFNNSYFKNKNSLIYSIISKNNQIKYPNNILKNILMY